MENYNEKFRDKTKVLALMIIEVTSRLAYTDAVGVIRKQLIRLSTSVAANYRAGGRARSGKERYAKLCIVVEEADETLFWIELMEALKIIPPDRITELKEGAEEIIKVMTSYRKKLSTIR